MEHVW